MATSSEFRVPSSELRMPACSPTSRGGWSVAVTSVSHLSLRPFSNSELGTRNSTQHPRVLAPSALTRVHDERPLPQRYPRQSARQDLDPVGPAQDVRAKVDVAAFQMAA